MDFEARLIIDPAHTLEEINARLWRWIESEYHQRTHSALEGRLRRNASPNAPSTCAPPIRGPTGRLFSCRVLNAGASGCHLQPGGHLWEAPVHLRGQLIQVRFNPFEWRRVEIWRDDKYVGPARRCDKQLNAKTYTDRDYDRPDKSS